MAKDTNLKENAFIEKILTEDYRGPRGQQNRSRLIDMGNGYYMRVFAAVGRITALLEAGFTFHSKKNILSRPFWFEILEKDGEGVLRVSRASRVDQKRIIPFSWILQTMEMVAGFRPCANASVHLCRNLDGPAPVSPATYRYDIPAALGETRLAARRPRFSGYEKAPRSINRPVLDKA